MSGRIVLNEAIRETLAEFVSLRANVDVTNYSAYLNIEEILTDYVSNKGVLDDLPKAAKTRDQLRDISKQVDKLSKSLDQLHRWTLVELAPVPDKNYLDRLSSDASKLADTYTDRKTTRVNTTHARDFAIDGLVDVFSEYAGTYASIGSRLDTEWLDNCELFVANALEYANSFLSEKEKVSIPAVKDTSRGEYDQGRLRIYIKKYLGVSISR